MLYRNWTSESTVFKGHSDSVSGFSVWGQDVISISRNKIGLSSLSRPAYEVRIQESVSISFYFFQSLHYGRAPESVYSRMSLDHPIYGKDNSL